MPEPVKITLQVNGEPRTAAVEPRDSLADCLREHLGLTGTHLGCEHGVCGAGTVVVDGRTARALLLAVEADGSEITDGGGGGDRGRASIPSSGHSWSTRFGADSARRGLS
jgi:carbon-monoxide dehydrogenase small subunit